MSEKVTLTTTAGAPIGDNQDAITAGPHGPVLLQDYQLLEKLAHQNRERIPERCPVHNYHQDGPMRFFEPATDPDAFYEPNSFNRPVEDPRLSSRHSSSPAPRLGTIIARAMMTIGKPGICSA